MGDQLIDSDGAGGQQLDGFFNVGRPAVIGGLDADFPVRRVLGPEVKFRWEEWDIPDPFEEDEEAYLRTAELLRARIARLLEREGVAVQEPG